MSHLLKADKLIETLDLLSRRISERFPTSGLARLCEDVLATARVTGRRARSVSGPNPAVTLGTWLIVILALGLGGLLVRDLVLPLFSDTAAWTSDPVEIAQALESVVNLVLLGGAAVWFLLTLETRRRRAVVLAHLHELRSLAHVVDMYQLTKDPVVILHKVEPTPSSPKREMSEFELARYLDYCSEMLALIGKLAALYAETSRDAEVIAAAGDVEALTTNLGRKIWQKIMLAGLRSPELAPAG
ncbi:MAG: hypothetical protein HXY25_05205 [Alphaproteobacteria bacterium]|nr:hypothetical protein [Alphaproteobacteria bacterium]